MAYDIFHSYGLDKIHDSLTENHDYKDNSSAKWEFVKSKSVMDSDGFMTDYAWYTDGETHIFMFGDIDITEPDEDYADWVAESQQTAEEWFNSYEGFNTDEDIWENFEEDDLDETLTGNADFINNGFTKVYGLGDNLED